MITEEIVLGENTEYPLNGIVTLPDDLSSPIPAVVFVHGAGMSDMDGSVGSMTPFKDMSVGLANHGIASIRYDKRTYAHVGKMMQDTELLITIKEETTEDALLATQLLRNDPRIDSDNIFIIGQNLGGMMAPRIDDEGGKYKGLILMGASPRKLEEILIEQNNDNYKKMNLLLKILYKSSSTKFNDSFKGIYRLTDEKAKRKFIGTGATAYYFKDIGEHTIETYLDKLNKPMLIMQGDKDKQVKVDKDFNGYKELLKDRDNVTFKLYPNLNQCFMIESNDYIPRVQAEVIRDLVEWIHDNAK